MRIKALFNTPKTKYGAKEIFRWLWRAWRGNRLQAVLNAIVGLLGVAVSLSSVWAVQHAIDVASHEVEGRIVIAVLLMGSLILQLCPEHCIGLDSQHLGNKSPEPYAAEVARPHFAF